jgi:riboflavin kinase/FMN adenylyltransferase
MRILRSIPELAQISGPVFLAIGVVDGVHRGHQAVISNAASHAEEAGGTAVVVTFDPHPAKFSAQGKPSSSHRNAAQDWLIRALGVSHLLMLKFDRELA